MSSNKHPESVPAEGANAATKISNTGLGRVRGGVGNTDAPMTKEMRHEMEKMLRDSGRDA